LHNSAFKPLAVSWRNQYRYQYRNQYYLMHGHKFLLVRRTNFLRNDQKFKMTKIYLNLYLYFDYMKLPAASHKCI